MIESPSLETILGTATDLSMVCELYRSTQTPTVDGFDPNDAVALYAAVEGIFFMGLEYTKLVTKFGKITKGTKGEVSSTSVTFTNVTRQIADFEFNQGGHEGMVMVVRLLSRGSSKSLEDTSIEFVGRCDQPAGGDKEVMTLTAKSIVGSIEVMIPRRKFGPDDLEGRPQSDPEFEGFIHMPQYGTITYVRREKKGGFLGWWNKKWVRHTLGWSSYSNLDANKVVPEVFGAMQMLGVLIAAYDNGSYINMRVAFTEGEIADFLNIRSTDYTLPITMQGTNGGKQLGKVGALNVDPDPTWIGPGNYSRTSVLTCYASGSAIDVQDEAPDVAAVVKGRLVKVPDTSNNWSGSIWSDDAAAHVRFLYTSPDYNGLDEAWMDDEEFGNCYWFNGTYIFNSEVSDFTFVDAG